MFSTLRHPRESGGPYVQDVSGAARVSSPPRKRGAGMLRVAWVPAFAGMTNEGAGMTRKERV